MKGEKIMFHIVWYVKWRVLLLWLLALTRVSLQFTYYIDEQDILDDLMIINKVCGGKAPFTKASPAQGTQLNASAANENAHEVSIEDGRLSYDKRW